MAEADSESITNSMEDKQLNFNRPFLSVRRFSPSAASSSPGGQDKRKTNHSLPDRSHIPVYKSEIVSGPLRNPGTVPFTWEKSPGRPKTEGKQPSKGQERPPSTPKLPPGRPLNSNKEDCYSSTTNLKLEKETLKDKIQEATSKVEDNDDDEEALFEAENILSRSESFFFNCSISGLSGLDGPDSSLSGRFLTDPNVQDFMMGRFLPAAKAMASETPPHPLPKKQPAFVQEQPRVVKKSLNVNQQHPLYQYRPGGVSPHYGPEALGIQTNDDDDDDDEFEHESSSVKVCGLLPRFLLKSSICILDPVQGIGMQEKLVSSVRRTKARSSNTNTPCESVKKHGGDVVNEELHLRRIETSDKSKTIEPKEFIGKIGSGGVELIPQEENRVARITETAQGKGCLSFRELLANEGDEWKASNSGPVVERTLYVDSVRHTKSVSSDSNNTEEHSSNRSILLEPYGVDDKVNEAPFLDSLARDIKVIDFLERNQVLSEHGSKDSFGSGLLLGSKHHDVKDIGVVEEDSNLCAPVDVNLSQQKNHPIKKDSRTSSNGFHSSAAHLERMYNGNGFGSNQEAHEKINTREIERDTTEKEDDGEDNFLKFLIPPPLPKSPSESWLFRTLPSVSSKNTSRWSPMAQQECDRNQITEPKWEPIVKSSNAHHRQFRPPHESLEPIPES